MARPRNPKGIRPLVKHARAYNAAIRRAYLDPFFTALQRRLALATATTQAFHALRDGVTAWEAQPKAGIPTPLIIEALGQVNAYDRARLISTFRSALAVDIRPFLK